MSLTRMPNGEYVNIADGTPPAVVARIRAQYPARPRAAAAAPAARTAAPAPSAPSETRPRERRYSPAELARRVASASDPLGNIPVIGNINRGVNRYVHEATLHLNDIAAPAVIAGARALGGGNFGNEYKAERENMRRERDRESERSPLATGVGGVMGMIRAPVPGFGKAAETALAARAVHGSTLANRAARTVLRGARTPIGNAAATGATQAGLTTLIDTGDVGKAGESAVLGGVLGAGASAVIGAGAGAIRAIRQRAPGAAENVAYDKIAAMLGRARDDTGAAVTPAAAVREIEEATAAGTPLRLGDMSPEMQGMRGEFARRTALPSSGDATAAAEQRLGSAADRFNDKINGTLKSNTGDDALAARARITEGRKADAARDYGKGGAMDAPLAPTPHLVNALTKPTPDMRDALKAAQRVFDNEGGRSKFMAQVLQGGKMVEVPTVRAFDEIKKAFDDIIESGIKHLPDGTKIASAASGSASRQLRALKDQVAASNPQYKELLARQRDAFERNEAIDAGMKFMTEMRDRPRELLANLTAKGAKNPEEVRTGLIDALLSARNKGSPIKTLRQWERNPQQRAVLEHVMGGPKAFNEFSKFMRRELRAMQGDALTMRKSNSPVLNEFAEHGEGAVSNKGPWQIASGAAYGGPLGGVSAAARVVDRMRNGMGTEAQDATLRLLDGSGEGLENGVAAARAAREARRQAAIARARVAGKLSGGTAAGLVGTGD